MKTTVGLMTEFLNKNPDCYEKVLVETRHGYRAIQYADITARNSEVWLLQLEHSNSIQCSPNHRVLTDRHGWREVCKLDAHDTVLTRSGYKTISHCAVIQGMRKNLYDFQVDDVHEFYANDIVSHNSALIDAISFGLFGKAYRNINKPQLVSSMNNSAMLVEIWFHDGKHSYKVKRGMKPNLFEIIMDGTLIDKDSKAKDYQRYLEENILRMNHKVFCQVVVLGSASFVPFMQLNPAERRTVVEDILGIDMISKMFSVLKKILSQHKQDIKDTKTELKTEEKLLAALVEDLKNWQSSFDVEQHQFQTELDGHTTKQQQIAEEALECIERVKVFDGKAIDEDLEKLTNELVDLQSNKSAVHARIEMKNDSISTICKLDGECPLCQSKIDEDKKTALLNTQSVERDSQQVQLDKILNDINTSRERIAGIRAKLEELDKEEEFLKDRRKQMEIIQASIKQTRKYMEDHRNKRDVIVSGFDEKKLAAETKISKTKGGILAMEEMGDYYEYLYELFKDSGIKAKIIELFIPIINKQISHYLDLFDFYVSFTLDSEFNEKILSRFKDEFSYGSFSEGEKRRIDIALLLTWRDVARMKNSVSTNIMWLDEVFDNSLDTNARDCFLNILTQMSHNTTVFVITHSKDDMKDKFDEHWKIGKKKDFSYIERE